MADSAGLFLLCWLQIRSQAVRGLKPLLRCSRTVAPASSSGKTYTTRAPHPVAASSIEPIPSPGRASSAQKWCLASLAAGAVAAYIAGKLERAPFTGRSQLIFDMYKSAPGQRAAMPAVPDLPRADPSATPLDMCSQHGDELLHAAYVRVAEAVAGLAARNPALQSRLASIPDRINLKSFSLSSGRGMHSYACGKDGELLGISLNPFHVERAASILLMAHAGSLLQQSTADEVVTSIAKELAHVIASHGTEQNSCRRLATFLSIAIGSAAIWSGVSFWPYLPAMMLASGIGNGWVARTWLHRQQVFEADAIASAISTAAGVNPSSVVTSMQRAYCADARTPDKANLQQVRKGRIQWHLAKLQSLLPQSQIPQDMISDSAAMQLVIAAAASEIWNASVQVKADYSKSISVLEDCLAEELCFVRNPYTAWTDINPHWLDRIAHVQNVLKHDSSLDVQGKGLNDSGQDVRSTVRYAYWQDPAKLYCSYRKQGRKLSFELLQDF